VAHAIGKRVACSAVFGPVTAEEQLILQGTMKLMSLWKRNDMGKEWPQERSCGRAAMSLELRRETMPVSHSVTWRDLIRHARSDIAAALQSSATSRCGEACCETGLIYEAPGHHRPPATSPARASEGVSHGEIKRPVHPARWTKSFVLRFYYPSVPC